MGLRPAPYSETAPATRLGRVVATLPAPARQALSEVAEREDLPLVAGSWANDRGGCLVANVVSTLEATGEGSADTLDLRVLALIPELGSRDLNRLIVAWDEAAYLVGDDDASLRALLRSALQRAAAGQVPAGR